MSRTVAASGVKERVTWLTGGWVALGAEAVIALLRVERGLPTRTIELSLAVRMRLTLRDRRLRVTDFGRKSPARVRDLKSLVPSRVVP